MRVFALSLLAALALVPAGAGAPRAVITPAAARTADAKIDEAIAKEREALAHVGTTGVLPHVFLYQSIDRLGDAKAAIRGAEGAEPIVTMLTQAAGLDRDGIDHQSDASKARILDDIRRALALKKKAQRLLVPYLGGASETCDTDKQFKLYAVPAGYAGSYVDVYPHGIPRNAQNLQIGFVDVNGHVAPKHPFPGQSWRAKIVGFETRGGETVLHVHIDITGTGLGKPDQKFVNWRVVVTWDC
jgi:hypothetical protein